jgi:hypothetical protein
MMDVINPNMVDFEADEPAAVEKVIGQPYNAINPLYDRLQRLYKRRYWWLAAIIGGLLFGIGQNFPSFFTGIFQPATFRNSQSVVPFVLFSAMRDTGAVIAFLIPILIGTIAVSSTARETASDSYDLILLTDLTNTQIIRAYVRNAFQRTRALWAFQIGLTLPALVVAFSRPQFFGGLGGFRYFGGAYLGQALVASLVRLSAYTPSLLVRVPWLILALLWGVWLAQRSRTISGAMLGAMLGVFIAQFLYATLSLDLLLNTTISNRVYGYSPNNPANGTTYGRVLTNQDAGYGLLAIVVALLVPFVAWLLFIRLPAQVRRRV